MGQHLLSKSSFLKFEQCPKAFYFYKVLPFFKDPVSAEREMLFRRGNDVGNFARGLFPGGVDISALAGDSDAALKHTAEHIASGTPVLYEATFKHNGVLVMVDILCRKDAHYVAYEVKSSLKVSEVYIRDACLQYYVLHHELPALEDFFLVTVHPEFIKSGPVAPRQFFRKRSIRAKALENFRYFELQVTAAERVLEESKVPDIPIGPQCFKPYQCDYFSVCWKDQMSDRSVFHMPKTSRETQFGWHRAGHHLIDQVPDELVQSGSLLRIRNAFQFNEPFYNLEAIMSFLTGVKEPVAAMDLEVWNPAIPVLDGTRPFEQVPFLAGVFDGKNEFSQFNAHHDDERRAFAEGLLELTDRYATLLVYDRNLETAVIGALGKQFPDLQPGLSKLVDKLADVFDIFLHLDFYHPAFRNSFSLKVVSSVLVDDAGYGEIGSGLEAMAYFDRFRNEQNPILAQTLRDNLIAYCQADCRATYRLFEYLGELVRKNRAGDQ